LNACVSCNSKAIVKIGALRPNYNSYDKIINIGLSKDFPVDKEQSYSVTCWVLESNVKKIESQVSQWQKKAQALGVSEPKIHFTGQEKIFNLPVYDMSDGNPALNLDLMPTIPALKKELIFTGAIPQLKGFQFLAKIEHSPNDDGTYSNIVFSPNSETAKKANALDTPLHECTPDCNHCESPRFRKSTFIVHNPEDNKTYQVGSTCIDDFIGKKTLSQVMASYDAFAFFTNEEVWDEFDRDYSSKFNGPETFPTTSLIELADFYTSNFGFNRADEMDSTKDRMLGALDMQRHEPPDALDIVRRAFDEKAPNENSDPTHAEKVLSWVRELENPDGNSYINNIKSITSRDFTNINTRGAIGLIASIPAAYQRHILHLERKKSQNIGKNEFFGTVKARGPLKLKLLSIKQKELGYGTNYLYTFSDNEMRTFSWKASSEALYDFKIGDYLEMTATIKGFYESPHNNTKYTNLSICKNITAVPSDHPVPDFEAGAKKRAFKDTYSFTPSHLCADGTNIGQGRMQVKRSWREGGQIRELNSCIPLNTQDVEVQLVSLLSETGIFRDIQNPRAVKKDAAFLNAGLKAMSPYAQLKKPDGVIFLVDDAYAPLLSGNQLEEGRRTGTPNERMQSQPVIMLNEDAAIRFAQKNHAARITKIKIPYWSPVLTPSSLLLSSQDELIKFKQEANADGDNGLVFVDDSGSVKRAEPLGLSPGWLDENYRILSLFPAHKDVSEIVGKPKNLLLRGFKTATITGLENNPDLMKQAKAHIGRPIESETLDKLGIKLDSESSRTMKASQASREMGVSLQFLVSKAEEQVDHSERLLTVTDSVTNYYLERFGADNVNIHITTPDTVTEPSPMGISIDYQEGMLENPEAFIAIVASKVEQALDDNTRDLKRARLTP
jgi:hypothetical protein